MLTNVKINLFLTYFAVRSIRLKSGKEIKKDFHGRNHTEGKSIAELGIKKN